MNINESYDDNGEPLCGMPERVTHGGARPGAGRKRKDAKDKVTCLRLRVPVTAEVYAYALGQSERLAKAVRDELERIKAGL